MVCSRKKCCDIMLEHATKTYQSVAGVMLGRELVVALSSEPVHMSTSPSVCYEAATRLCDDHADIKHAQQLWLSLRCRVPQQRERHRETVTRGSVLLLHDIRASPNWIQLAVAISRSVHSHMAHVSNILKCTAGGNSSRIAALESVSCPTR